MAFPTILVNSASGSDSAASGAGPGTALTGSSASTDGAGTLVTLDGSPDLTNVATDGSHVVYLADATAGNRNFGKITAKDNGAKTVTVSNAFGLSLSGLSWAIGGKRASIGATSSKKLFDNNGAAGDAMPGWVVEMESAHSETIAATYHLRRNGDQTDGLITLRGASGAGTLPVLTFSNNGHAIGKFANYTICRDFELRNSNATKTSSIAITDTPSAIGRQVLGIKIAHATDRFWKGIVFTGSNGAGLIRDCEIGHCASHAITIAANAWSVLGCTIHDCGGHGISIVGGSRIAHVIRDNLIWDCTADGINRDSGASAGDALTVDGNTIYSCDGDGIEIAVNPGSASVGLIIANNILASNGAYGVNFSNGAATTIALTSTGVTVTNNNTHSNTSGAYNPSGYGSNDPGLDPQFTSAPTDLRIGTNLKAQGYPEGNLPGLSVRSYKDIGGLQREEAGGGTTINIFARTVRQHRTQHIRRPPPLVLCPIPPPLPIQGPRRPRAYRVIHPRRHRATDALFPPPVTVNQTVIVTSPRKVR